MARSSLVVGAHLRVYINGQPFGRTISGMWRSGTPRRLMQGLDTPTPSEAIPLATSTSGTLRVYRMHADGGTQAAGIVAPQADISLEKYFSILILDRVTDTVLFRADNCALQEESWELPTRGHVIGTLSFVSLGWSNETVSKMTGVT